MKKKANKRMPTPKQKLIHNPIPTSLFVVSLCKHTFSLEGIYCACSMFNNRYISERNKDNRDMGL